MAQTLHPAITILIALAPAALALWWGRGISRRLDDPLLPERLLANRLRNGPVFGVTVGLLIATSMDQFTWALPLLVLTRIAAAYPLRKALHHETWSFAAYFWLFARLIVALVGPLILLALMPLAAMDAASPHWIVVGALAVIIAAWHMRYSAIFRWMLRARPLDDAEVVSRFKRMLETCGLSAVSLEQVDLHGGAYANAVALTSIHRPAVVVTDTLLERLDRDETMAVLAHELAHLEYYNPVRLRRNSAVTYALIAIGALLCPVLRVTAPQTIGAAPLLWPIFLLVVGLLRVQHRQKHETESDLRAVELTGDAEAVVRALTKLHAFARVPRRWDMELERHATHPSLSRRIQAIHAAAGTAQASIGEAATFAAATGVASVTFHEQNLEWHDSASTIRAIDYGQLVELRIHARASGAPRLLAVDSKNRRSEIVLQSSDVARVQSVLDVVDSRLGKGDTPPAVPLSVARLLAMLTIFAAMAISQMSVVIAGLLAVIRPASQLAAATGVSALAAAMLTWRDHAVRSGEDPLSWVAPTLCLSGAALLGVAFANRVERTPGRVPKLVALLACSSALAWGVVAMHGIGALELHRSTLEWPGVSIVTLGLAGALAFARSPRARWAAAPLALAGLSAGFLGSEAFVDRFVSDPFVSPAPVVGVTTLTGPPLTEFSVGFDASSFWISPTGLYAAVRTEDDDQHSTIHAGRAGGPFTDFAADDVAFLDDRRLFLLKRQPGVSELRVIDLSADNRETWSVGVPMSWPALSIDRQSERWRLLGWDTNQNFESVEGHIGDGAVSEKHWKSPADAGEDVKAIAVSNGVVLAIESRRAPVFRGPFWRWPPFRQLNLRVESRLWALGERGSVQFATSRVDLDCGSSILIDQAAMCSSFDGGRTRFFAVNPASRRLTALAAVPGRVFVEDSGDRGWVVGWWDRGPAAFEPGLREAIRLAPADGERPDSLAMGETVIASVISRGERSTIRVYSMPPRLASRR